MSIYPQCGKRQIVWDFLIFLRNFLCKKNLNNIDLFLTLDYDFRAAVALLERWLKLHQAQQAKKKTPTALPQPR